MEDYTADLQAQQTPFIQLLDTATTTSTLTGTQILATLLTGLLMAFAFQLLLTNLGIAAGITALGFQTAPRSNPEPPANPEPKDSNQQSGTIRLIGIAAGLGILLTLNTVLFAACFLAVKLSLVQDSLLGAILGIVIWSAYFLLLTWISSTAVGSVLTSLLGSVTSGLRKIIEAIALPFRPESSSLQLDDPEAIATLRHAVQSALNPTDLRSTLEDYLETLPPPPPDLQSVRQEFRDWLSHLDRETLAQIDRPDRQTLLNWVSDRPDLPPETAEQLTDQLESAWEEVTEQTPPQPRQDTQALSFLETADPKELQSKPLSHKLKGLALESVNFRALLTPLLKRVDLSDLDVETLWHQLRSLSHSLPGPIENLLDWDEDLDNVIRSDIEDYLLNAYPWHLTRDQLDAEFKEVIYDPEAAPEQVQQQIEQIQPADLVAWLKQRQDLSAEQVEEIGDRLEAVRQNVLADLHAQSAQAQSVAEDLQQKLESYLLYTNLTKLTPEGIQHKLEALREEIPGHLQANLPTLDREALAELLQRRQGLEPEYLKQILSQIADSWQEFAPAVAAPVANSMASSVAESVDEAQSQTVDLTKTLSDAFQQIDWAEIDLEIGKHHLVELLSDPKSGIRSIGQLLTQVDWRSLIQQLQQASNWDAETALSLALQIRTTLRQKARFPRRWLIRVRHRFSEIWGDMSDLPTLLQDYLQQTKLPDFDEDQIRQGLLWLLVGSAGLAGLTQLQSAFTGQISLSRSNLEDLTQRLSAFSPEEVGAALSQRADLTQAEVAEIGDRIESVRHQLLDQIEDQIEQAQQQTQSSLEEVWSDVQDAVTHLQLPELSYGDLKQDLKTWFERSQPDIDDFVQSLQASLLESPLDLLRGTPLDSLKKRLTQFGRETLTTLIQTKLDWPETVTHTLTAQVAGVEDWMEQRLTDLDQQIQQQISDLKLQAQQQVEATRKTAAIASWWLFSIALTSATTAAIAGMLATQNLQISLSLF